MLKITIYEQDGKCKIDEKKPKVKKKEKVRWYAKDTDVFVDFAKNQWPFDEDWPGCIAIKQGETSKKYKTDEKGTWFYDYGCSKCPKKGYGILASARIIIN